VESKRYYCPCCKEKVSLKMFPDYSSNGIWCKKCGVNLEGIELPTDLADLLDMWIFTYSVMDDDKRFRTEHMLKLFNLVGRDLCEKVNQYYECEYIPEEFEHCFG